MKLLKTATEKLKPIAENVLPLMWDKLSEEEVIKLLEGTLKGLTGKGYGVALQQVNATARELLKHDLSQGRVNINIIPSLELQEEVMAMQPQRADKYRPFIALDRIEKANKRCRPTIFMNKLSDAKTFTIMYTYNAELKTFSIVGVVVIYGSSLTSWAEQAGLKRSACDLSQWPSTHYIENPEHFVKVFQ